MLFTETWTDYSSDLHVDNFSHYVLNRTEKKQGSKRTSGGIIVYLRDKYVSSDTLVFTSGDDVLCIKISKTKLCTDKDMFFCLTYIVPENSSRQSMLESHTFDRILDFVTQLNASEGDDFNLVFCGDMNAHTSDKPDFVENDTCVNLDFLPTEYNTDNVMQRMSKDKGRTNSYGELLLDLCRQTGLRILNGRCGDDKEGHFTHVGSRGSSVVDYVITTQNLIQNVLRFKVEDPNLMSDHCVIDFTFIFDKCMYINNNDNKNTCKNNNIDNICDDQENVQRSVNYKYVWDSTLRDEYVNNLGSQDTLILLENFNSNLADASCSSDIDSCISEFANIIDKASSSFKRKLYANDACRSSKNDTCNTTNNQPWFNEECFETRNLFYHALNNYRIEKSDQSRAQMVNARSKYKTCIRKARLQYDKAQTDKLINARFKNAKLYWSMLKQTAGIKQTNIQINMFEQYFRSVNNPNDPFFTADEDVLHFISRYENNELEIMFQELNRPIELDCILKAIKQLSTNKSGGPDMYLNEFFIHGKATLATYLKHLFNKLFDLGYFPQSWSEGYVIPLHKKGSIDDVNNYRGITLLSTIGKLFSRVLNNRLTDWAENYNVYIEAQAGFRSRMGTVDNIFCLHGIINHLLNQGKQLYCAFIDFTKAFDYIVRENLWYKLIHMGIRGKILNIMKSMYDSVKSMVKFQNNLSDSYNCLLGVRQGESLSPFLFSMFLNDLEDIFIKKGLPGIDVNMFKIFLILYADDIIIFANNAKELQESLDELLCYCQRWKLIVNTNKTKIMGFRKSGRIPNNLRFTYNNAEIEIVTKFTYLGIVFTSSGSFSEAQNVLAGQAQKAIFQMNKYLYKFTDISIQHRLDLFDKLVSPILCYSSEVWGFIHGKAIEKVHLQFCKRILGVKKTTQNDFIYGDLGRIDFKTRRYVNIIKYWLKLLTLNENKFAKKVYLMLKIDSETRPEKENWCTLLKNLLSNLGLFNAWYFQQVGNQQYFMTLVKQRLTDHFIQNWNSRLDNSSRAIFYKNVTNFGFQFYLKSVNISKFRQSLSKLRMSSHRLQVEAGRWSKPNPTPHNERKCLVCNKIEDEFHFLLECQLYTDIRHKFISQYYTRNPSMIKLQHLLTNENESQIRKLAMFVDKAFCIRNNANYC